MSFFHNHWHSTDYLCKACLLKVFRNVQFLANQLTQFGSGIDAKGIIVAQSIWSSGCPTWAQKKVKQKKMHFSPFWAYIRHPKGHIDWATLLPFASIYPTNPRTNSWNFLEKVLKIGRVENLFFNGPVWICFQKIYVFCFIPMKFSQHS